MWASLLTLHENRRLIYIFDGMNELLQRNVKDKDNTDKQYARNIMEFLYRFANGNPCIISMCEMRDVITTRSICMDEADKYQIYAVKGVRLNKKETQTLQEKRWMQKLVSNVALYRLAANADSQTQTRFSLLEKYVIKQIESELVNVNDSSECRHAIRKTIESVWKKEGFLQSPYGGYEVDDENEKWFRYLSNTKLFYCDAEGDRCYHPGHILIHEFFLADYAMNKFFNNEEQTPGLIEDFVDFFCGDENNGDDQPDLLEYTYLKSVFVMLITHVAKNDNGCQKRLMKYLNAIVQRINKKNECSGDRNGYINAFLITLSQIKDNLQDLDPEHENEALIFGNEPTESLFRSGIIDRVKMKNIPVFDRFAFYKLLSCDDRKEVRKEIEKDLLGKDWSYLSVQRDYIQFSLKYDNSCTGDSASRG